MLILIATLPVTLWVAAGSTCDRGCPEPYYGADRGWNDAGGSGIGLVSLFLTLGPLLLLMLLRGGSRLLYLLLLLRCGWRLRRLRSPTRLFHGGPSFYFRVDYGLGMAVFTFVAISARAVHEVSARQQLLVL